MGDKFPTYGELITLLSDAEAECESDIGQAVADILVMKFTSHWPNIRICRPGRFFDIVKRLAAPTRQSDTRK